MDGKKNLRNGEEIPCGLSLPRVDVFYQARGQAFAPSCHWRVNTMQKT